MSKSVYLQKKRFRCEHRHTAYEHPFCWQRFAESQDNWRVGYFDIEASNLKADFGWMISWAIKPADSLKVQGYVLKKRDYRNKTRDKKAVFELIKTLATYDQIVTYYGSRFDVPFARTRALIHGFQFIPPKTIRHLDLYYQVRGKLRLSRNRLENAGETLGLFTEKTRISTQRWSQVGLSYDKAALDYIWDHNVKDVFLLQELHEMLKPYIQPNKTWL